MQAVGFRVYHNVNCVWQLLSGACVAGAKLLDSFWSEKKSVYDISKVRDRESAERLNCCMLRSVLSYSGLSPSRSPDVPLPCAIPFAAALAQVPDIYDAAKHALMQNA